MANQLVDMPVSFWHMARKLGAAPAGCNPCRFVKKYPTRSCERLLSEQEFRRLGAVLKVLQSKGNISDAAAAALRRLMLTGCRR